jgi:hypothetical protein
VGGLTFHNNQNGNNIAIASADSVSSILDIAFLQDLTEDTRRFRKAEKIAIAFGNEDFRSVLRKSGIMLRLILSADKISQIWEEITGEKGEFKGYNFYRIPDGEIKSSYWVRLIHEKKEVGLRLTFNKFNKMAGMHIDQSFSFGGPTEVEGLIINDSLIFIDGFRYGYPDTFIHKQGEHWVLKTQSAEFVIECIE